MIDKELRLLHSNQRLVVEEMQRRGIEVELINLDMELVKASYKGHIEFMLDRNTSIMPYSLAVILGDKYLTKKILSKTQISVPQGLAFCGENKSVALIYANDIGYPVTLKPIFGSHGDLVYVNIKNEEELSSLLSHFDNKDFIIEKYFEGREYRVFVTKNGDYAVLNRDPAHVIGDGKHSIKELVDIENNRRAERTNSLCPILIDDIAERFLNRQNISMSYVPKEDEKIYVRDTSNVAKGGVCVDCTDIVHPSVIEICMSLLNIFDGLPYAGIDFMTKDITQKQTKDSYAIIEVNTVPGVHMHVRPGKGKPRNVPKMLVDLIFPETKEE